MGVHLRDEGHVSIANGGVVDKDNVQYWRDNVRMASFRKSTTSGKKGRLSPSSGQALSVPWPSLIAATNTENDMRGIYRWNLVYIGQLHIGQIDDRCQRDRVGRDTM
jgi:hypothetical protein